MTTNFFPPPVLLLLLDLGSEMDKSQDAGQCCGSGIFIPDPDFYPTRIPDPKTATKDRGEKKFVVIPFEMLREKNLRQLQNLGLGSVIRKKPIPNPRSGFRGQKGTAFRIRIRNTDPSYS
jgi:hypothetical protein